ncbi:hypothetical protein [Streptomyces sp. AK02-01A]|uniref:hypothetical protein n=1 Tax=Streptomyces sp. AK02-01A TaxID=3028648 RepID=UPI0029AA9D6C|nr:hypothetical protein [Streptomyces sp. AK02-01A]MDX3850547.1 hypothetical protein [Streptomyces sp. AK02-01A]
MKVTLQFHGDRREIYVMVWEWARESGMLLVEERFFPTYELQQVGGVGEVSGMSSGNSDVDRISLNPSPVDLSATSSRDYAQKNPDSLFITLGEQSDDILKESFLAAMTDDATLVKVWKRLRERARKSMCKGAWAENTMSGAQSRVASHYYTEKAKQLAEVGVVPIGGTGWIKYRFD